MLKKIMLFAVSGLFLLSLYGCFALLAGGAAGAGTAVWLSGKLTQKVDASYEKTIDAARSALKSMQLEVLSEKKAKDVAQIKSRYTDGKEIWIDIRPISGSSTKVEVRVGAVSDKEAAEEILKKIVGFAQ